MVSWFTRLPECRIDASVNWVNIGITWTNADFWSIGPLGTNSSEIRFKIHFFIDEDAFEKIVSEMAAILSRGDELNQGVPEMAGHKRRLNILYTLQLNI